MGCEVFFLYGRVVQRQQVVEVRLGSVQDGQRPDERLLVVCRYQEQRVHLLGHEQQRLQLDVGRLLRDRVEVQRVELGIVYFRYAEELKIPIYICLQLKEEVGQVVPVAPVLLHRRVVVLGCKQAKDLQKHGLVNGRGEKLGDKFLINLLLLPILHFEVGQPSHADKVVHIMKETIMVHDNLHF